MQWPDDDIRPLSAQGKLRTQAACVGLARLEPEITLIMTSPLLRCMQTAELLSEVASSGAGLDSELSLAPAGSRDGLVQRLAAVRDTASVVLVGHEPDLGRLAGWMLLGTGDAFPLRKAGACSIDFDGRVNAGGGSLNWYLSPRYLRDFGKKKVKKKVRP